MKFNKKKMAILITLQFVLALANNCFNYLSNNPLIKEKNLEIRDKTSFKTSGYWVIDPILIDGSGSALSGMDWTMVEMQLWFGGGNGSWSNPYILENITIDGQNDKSCISIVNSNVFFILRNCTLYNSSYDNGNRAGINLYNVNNSKIINNNCSFNNGNGICIRYSNNNTFTGNIVSNNSVDGIYMEGSYNNRFSENTITGNTNGIQSSGDNANFIGNTVNFNDVGIYIKAAQNNIISENIINNNTYAIQSSGDNNNFIGNTVNFNNFGIDIESSNDNIISGNNINNNNLVGISLNDCNNSISSGNTIYSSHEGLILIESNDNTISNNKIYDIIEIGVKLLSNTGKCANNLFYNNNFTNLGAINAVDNGTNNQWDNGTLGNYWHDYTGSDKNDDGIGDTPYHITGSAGSLDNYPIWDDGPEQPNGQPRGDNTIMIIIITASIIGAAAVASTIAIILRRRMRGERVISKETVEPEIPPEQPEENE